MVSLAGNTAVGVSEINSTKPQAVQQQSGKIASFFKAAKDFITAPGMNLAELAGEAPSDYRAPKSIVPVVPGFSAATFEAHAAEYGKTGNDFQYFNPEGFDFSIRPDPQENPFLT